MECFLRAEDHVTGHAIFEFADIPRPFALLQQLQCFAGDGRGVALETAVEELPEIVNEIRNVVAAIARAKVA